MRKEWVIGEEDLGCDGAYLSSEKVIRCKDCKWYTPYRNIKGEEMDEGECEGYAPCVPANHFCSWGERK